jgi:predicted MFS family arabinose efflux permease
MAATLYDATFTIVTRAHGERARDGITAITLAAGFASTLAYPLVAAATAAWGWTAPVWMLVALVLACVLPLHVFAARRLDAAARNRPPGPARRARSGADSRGRGTSRLAAAFGLAALGVAVMITLLLPLLAAFGVPDRLAVLSAAIVGPAQVIGRVVLLMAGARRAALGLTVSAFLLLGAAAVAMGAAAALPALALVFAAALGLGNGVVSILRPVVIREVLGEAGFGANAGVVARAWLWAFAAAPTLGALIADTAGYAAVVVLCVAAPLAGAAVLRPLAT